MSDHLHKFFLHTIEHNFALFKESMLKMPIFFTQIISKPNQGSDAIRQPQELDHVAGRADPPKEREPKTETDCQFSPSPWTASPWPPLLIS